MIPSEVPDLNHKTDMNLSRYKIPWVVVVFIIVGAGVSSCDRERVYEEHIEVPDRSWNPDLIMQFHPQVSDTTNTHNIYINIRNTPEYSFSNIFLFVTTTSPSGSWIRDTVEIQLADERGNWLGKGVSHVFFSRRIFKLNVRFPEPGIYGFEIQQGMRSDELTGVRDVGLRIERVEKKE